MDFTTNFFHNTNPNVQQIQYPLQPFLPTPNPRSRFPQNLSAAPGLNIPQPDPFSIPPDNKIPLIPFPGSPAETFQHYHHAHPMSIQSPTDPMQTQPMNPQPLQVMQPPRQFNSPGAATKSPIRKKGFSVGTNENIRNYRAGLDQRYGYYPEAGNDIFYGDNQYAGYKRNFGIAGLEKGLTPSDIVANMELSQKSANLRKSFVPEERDKETPEEILSTIEENQINTVSMLNEVSSKIKKRVEYVMSESPVGKNRVFECVCLMDKTKIGIGKGNSKQAAKTEAAKAAIYTLLTKENYIIEGDAIRISVQKTKGPGSHSPSIASKSNQKMENSGNVTSDRGENSPSSSVDTDKIASFADATSGKSGGAHMNDSPLYELNVIAKECFIEPKWTLSPQPNQNGEFEVELRFDRLVAQGKGKKKQDAKRDAAIKIIKQIRANQDLSNKFNPNNPKKNSRNFETYLISLGQRCKLEASLADHFRDLFKKILDYTSMVTSCTKQVMMNAPRHIADYINNCYLIPMGSFALGSLRNDKLVADCMLVFHEIKEISDQESLELLKQALEECQSLDKQSGANLALFHCNFAIKANHMGSYLEITNIKENKDIKMCIYLTNLSHQGCASEESPITKNFFYRISHVQQIYSTLEDLTEDLSSFRTLLIALRLWREQNDLTFLSSEILDVLLLSEIITNPQMVLTSIMINCLKILACEESMKVVLSGYQDFYSELYNVMSISSIDLIIKAIPHQGKVRISTISNETLNNIYTGNFEFTKLT